MINLLFCSWNRLAYTKVAFNALLEHTDWSRVATLFLADDASHDGTREWLEGRAVGFFRFTSVRIQFLPSPFGGPVAAGNLYLDHATPGVEIMGKVDNDTIVPPGWLPEMLRVLDENPEVDMLGMAPRLGPPQHCPHPRTVEYADWIDGNGIWRHRAFRHSRPVPGHSRGRFGMTEWMGNHPEIVKAWIRPDMPVFQLDAVPIKPWVSLATNYRMRKWQRKWPPFEEDAHDYWDWHLNALVTA